MDRLDEAAVVAWVDGGWGVDALVREETRPHDDLDLVIDREAVDALVIELVAEGFEIERDWRPTAIALRHADGRAIDLHPVALTADGGGDQVQRDGKMIFHYDTPVEGMIGGRVVRCCSVHTQVVCHLGYVPDENDRLDMTLLQRTFGVDLPAPYDST